MKERAKSAIMEDSSSSREETSDERFVFKKFAFALSAWKNTVGCAYYDSSTGVLYVMEDADDLSNGYELVSMLLQQTVPEVIILSSTAEESLATCVEKTVSDLSSGSSGETVKDDPRLISRPSGDFSASKGILDLKELGVVVGTDMSNIRLGSHRSLSAPPGGSEIMDNTVAGNANLTANAFVNCEASKFSLAAVAALMSYLRKGAHRQSETGDRSIFVSKIDMLKVKNFMHLGTDALSSLQIFDRESHANLHFSTTKEGLSLYGILNECVTYNGKLLLKNWLIRPSTEVKVIESRQDDIECFLKSENAEFSGKIRQHLKSLGNISRTILIIASGKSRVGEWNALLNSIRACLAVYQAFSALETPVKTKLVLRLLGSSNVENLQPLARRIDETIDWHESKLNGGRTTVRCGIDDELDDYREKYAALESQLSHLSEKLRTEMPFNFLTDFTINYFPQIGYLCTIPRCAEWDPDEPSMEGGWSFQFSTDSEVHYKNDYMRDLDDYFGDVSTAINDREIEIVHLLEEELSQVSSILLSIGDDLAELDCILSLARVSFQREWVRPKIVNENAIQIISGRHPLVEGCVDTYISNDTHLTANPAPVHDNECPKASPPHSYTGSPMLVLTGANFSGKSVYLKQVAIIVVLAQLGCFVPAREAHIGIHDAIFTRVTTTESASRNSSAFMIDLQNVSFMLRNCTAQSILLIDEFGKGTDPTDGQALFCSVIEHLVGRGVDCPTTILTTHFHAVFTHGYLSLDLPIDYAHMEIVVPSENKVEVDHSPTYLYKLEPGLVRSSHALGCAALAGVTKHVRLKAERVSHLLSRFEILELLDNQMDEQEQEELMKMEDIVRRFIATDFEKDGSKERSWIAYLSEEVLAEE